MHNFLRTSKPFLIVAIVWCFIAFLILFGVSKSVAGFVWLLGFWFLSVLDIFIIAKLVLSLLSFVSAPSGPQTEVIGDSKKPIFLTQIILWLVAKLVCLGLFGACLFLAGESAPKLGVFLGISTIIVVPLFGGLWWSYKELSHARAA